MPPVEEGQIVPSGDALLDSRGHSRITQRGTLGNADIFFAAVEMTRMPMLVTDPSRPDNPIIFCNAAFCDLTGYDHVEVMGRNCRFLQGAETDRESIARVRAAVQAQTDLTIEILNYRKDGAPFWNQLYISPIFGSDGRLLYYFASQLNVTRRRNAERALRQAQRLEAVGQLTGGVAHDFNNLLTIIQGHVELLQGGAAAPAGRTARSLRAIGDAVAKGARLTQQLLSFARKQQLDDRAVNLNTAVASLRTLIAGTLGEQIAIETSFAPALAAVRLDVGQFEVALLNVLLNARDAMPSGGLVRITTGNRAIGPEEAERLGDIEPGDYVLLEVEDSGHGMAPDVLERAAEPFFTTKDIGRGTGLGLSMVYGFVRQSRGHLGIRSKPARGTTVTLLFPAAPAPQAGAAVSERPRAAAPVGGSESILVVEDNSEVRALAGSILSDLGYEVYVARDADEALRLLAAGPGTIDLLFTDVVMPGGKNGVTLAHEVRALRPGIRVLLTTGFSDHEAPGGGVRRGEFAVIEKPYRRADLALAVREAIDGRNSTG